jgi:hypothetical protein
MAKSDTERELFAAFVRFARSSRLSLDDPALPAAFAAAVGSDLANALQSAIWLHGNRVQNMFAAMVIAFDHHVLIKTEDAGEIEPKEGFALPDFRLVLKSGEQLLVEVKNVYAHRPERQRFSIKQRYLAKLQNYAQAVGTPLRLAVFFARWGLWTLIDPADLVAKGNSLVTDMGAAMRVSEMAKIGDQTIGTRAPLQLRFLADPNKPRGIDDANMLSMTIGALKVYCQDTEVVSERDREIVWLMIQFGEWEGHEPTVLQDGPTVLGIQFSWTPVEPSDDGFNFVGSASRMFARYYSLQTVKDSEIVRVAPEIKPGAFAMLTTGDHESDGLPLWRFILRPNRRNED